MPTDCGNGAGPARPGTCSTESDYSGMQSEVIGVTKYAMSKERAAANRLIPNPFQ